MLQAQASLRGLPAVHLPVPAPWPHAPPGGGPNAGLDPPPQAPAPACSRSTLLGLRCCCFVLCLSGAGAWSVSPGVPASGTVPGSPAPPGPRFPMDTARREPPPRAAKRGRQPRCCSARRGQRPPGALRRPPPAGRLHHTGPPACLPPAFQMGKPRPSRLGQGVGESDCGQLPSSEPRPGHLPPQGRPGGHLGAQGALRVLVPRTGDGAFSGALGGGIGRGCLETPGTRGAEEVPRLPGPHLALLLPWREGLGPLP